MSPFHLLHHLPHGPARQQPRRRPHPADTTKHTTMMARDGQHQLVISPSISHRSAPFLHLHRRHCSAHPLHQFWACHPHFGGPRLCFSFSSFFVPSTTRAQFRRCNLVHSQCQRIKTTNITPHLPDEFATLQSSQERAAIATAIAPSSTRRCKRIYIVRRRRWLHHSHQWCCCLSTTLKTTPVCIHLICNSFSIQSNALTSNISVEHSRPDLSQTCDTEACVNQPVV